MHVENNLNRTIIVDKASTERHWPFLHAEKRVSLSDAFQTCLAIAGLLLLSPLFTVIGILIKLTSRGPVFYRGLRVGRQGEVFQIYKFRTLEVGAEEKIGARLLNDQDAYYTAIGRFLKKTKLDELPQLLNVLKGEMNLVGPRPIRPIFLESLSKDIPQYPLRFAVKPGMTGLAQIQGGYFTDPRDKLRYELVYIKNRSLLLDVKLIFLTFLKLLNRWFTLGVFCLLLFLFISFVPKNVLPSTYIYVLGFRINLIHLLIVLGGSWILAKRIPKNKLHIYKCPLNIPMLIFFAFSFVTSFFAIQPFTAIRGTIYYAVTGFILVFLIINGDINKNFLRNSTRIVALFTVIVALSGLLELFLLKQVSMMQVQYGNVDPNGLLPRISSTMGNPVILSTYLVLGFPLILCELADAKKKEAHDFWLICATIVFMSIILTQTRLGLLALGVTGSIFFYSRSRRHFWAFVCGVLLLFVTLTFLGGSRYAPQRVLVEWNQAVGRIAHQVSELSPQRLFTGIGARNSHNFPDALPARSGDGEGEKRGSFANMHVILLMENGIVGWCIMMWIWGAALKSLYSAYQRVKDPHLQMLLWAIFSSTTGFLISMNNFDALFHLSTQVLFWGLLGIGMAIVVHFSGRQPGFVRLWRFKDQ